MAKWATVVAAIGSQVAMFIVGNHQRSIILIGVIAAWVLSPYVALALLDARSGARWPRSRSSP